MRSCWASAIRVAAIAAAVGIINTAAWADTFVLVHGAFQSASAWTQVAGELRKAGHDVIAVDLPGRDAVGDNLKELSLESYRDAVLAAVRQRTEPVVLVGHSAGGLTISAVAEAEPARVKRLVYVAAYLPVSGDSLQSLSGQDKDSKFTKENFVLAPDYSYADVLKRDRALIFAQDGSAEVRQAVENGLLKEPLAPMAAKIAVSSERFGKVSKVYVKTLKDNAVSPSLQDMMIARAPGTKVIPIDAGHVPHMTKPEELAKALLAAAQ